ncbi:hypothetical protein D3C71_2214080 [compost metagenome]
MLFDLGVAVACHFQRRDEVGRDVGAKPYAFGVGDEVQKLGPLGWHPFGQV